jgi:chorismate synthase
MSDMMKYFTAGESHGPQLTAIIDGFPAGLRINQEQLDFQLARRQKGYGRGGRMQIESDRAQVVSGLRHGYTLGSPITIVIANRDWENWSQIMDPFEAPPEGLGLKLERLAKQTTYPRPGHADLAGGIKYNHKDLRNVLERASARETAARTAVGAFARQLLEHFGVQFASHVVAIGPVGLPDGYDTSDLEALGVIAEQSEVRCIDSEVGSQMIAAIREARRTRDSLGGIAELIIRGVPVGLGSYSQWSRRLDGRLAGALMSIQSVKGVEIGLGFRGSDRRGSQFHDEVFYDESRPGRTKGYYRKTNNAGGVEGGMTNGEDVVARVFGKPISTLNRPLRTVDVTTHEAAEAMVERTDNCVTPALAVICEAVGAITVAEAFLEKFGGDNVIEIERAYRGYCEGEY